RNERVERPVADEPRSRSRVIVAAPSISPSAPRVAARQPDVEYRTRPPVEAEPPPSTPLPARVTHRPEPAHAAAADAQPAVEDSARSRFERELERARARTAEREPAVTGRREPRVEIRGERQTVVTDDGMVATEQPTRDPSRPAVGTVISLPPRI